MKTVRVAVIGAGHLGKIHARIYHQHASAHLVGVCDVNAVTAQHGAAEYNTTAYQDYRDLFGRVDAVSIATPTGEHFRIARDFLKHDVHVMMEKPITNTTAEADQLISLARRRRRILQVGHVERFNPAIRSAQRLCKHPLFIECHRMSPYPHRGTDVSVVMDLMIHDIDIILSFVKAPLVDCRAIGVKVLSACEDIANTRLAFGNGTICNLTASRVSNEGLRKIRIFEHNSYISIDYAQQKITVYTKKKAAILKQEIPVPRREPLADELASFLGCIRQGNQPVVCGRDAKEALRIALLITNQIRRHAS